MTTPGNPLAAFAVVVEAGRKVIACGLMLHHENCDALDNIPGATPDKPCNCGRSAMRESLAALPRAVDEGAVEALAEWLCVEGWIHPGGDTEDCAVGWDSLPDDDKKFWTKLARAILLALTPPEPGR